MAGVAVGDGGCARVDVQLRVDFLVVLGAHELTRCAHGLDDRIGREGTCTGQMTRRLVDRGFHNAQELRGRTGIDELVGTIAQTFLDLFHRGQDALVFAVATQSPLVVAALSVLTG